MFEIFVPRSNNGPTTTIRKENTCTKSPEPKTPSPPSPKTQGRDPQRWAPTLSTNTPPPPPPVQKTPNHNTQIQPGPLPAPSLAQRPSSHTLVIGVRDSASPHDVIGRLAAPDLLLVRSTPRPLQAPRERKPTPVSATPPAGGRDGDKAARPDSLAERARRHHRGPTAARASHVRRGAHHTPPRAKTRHDDRGARGMATAGSRSVGRRASTPSPEFTGRPMPGLRPPSTARPPTATDAMHGKEPAREHAAHPGGSSPAPPCPPQWSGIAPTRARREARAPRSNVVQCRAAQALRHVKAGDGHRTVPRGAKPPRTPPVWWGGPRPPPPC